MTAASEKTPTTPKGPTEADSTEELRHQLAAAEHRREASDRYLAASSQVLKVIGRPSADLNDVFATVASKR